MLKTAGFLCALCFYGCFKNNPLKLLWPYGLGISILSIIFFGERERELCYEGYQKFFSFTYDGLFVFCKGFCYKNVL